MPVIKNHIPHSYGNPTLSRIAQLLSDEKVDTVEVCGPLPTPFTEKSTVIREAGIRYIYGPETRAYESIVPKQIGNFIMLYEVRCKVAHRRLLSMPAEEINSRIGLITSNGNVIRVFHTLPSARGNRVFYLAVDVKNTPSGYRFASNSVRHKPLDKDGYPKSRTLYELEHDVNWQGILTGARNYGEALLAAMALSLCLVVHTTLPLRMKDGRPCLEPTNMAAYNILDEDSHTIHLMATYPKFSLGNRYPIIIKSFTQGLYLITAPKATVSIFPLYLDTSVLDQGEASLDDIEGPEELVVDSKGLGFLAQFYGPTIIPQLTPLVVI